MRSISAGDQDEPDADVEVARAALERAEAEMRVAAARLELARAEKRRARASVGDDSSPDDTEPDDAVPGSDEGEADEGEADEGEADEANGEGETDGGRASGVRLRVVPNDSSTTDPARARSSRARLLWAVLVVLIISGAAAVVVQRTSGAERTDEDGLASGIALRVGRVEITEAVLARRVQTLKILYGIEVPATGPELATFRRETARSLATSIVIDEAARDEGIEVSPADLSAALDRYVQARYQGDQKAAFEAELAKNGITEKDVREEIARQLTGQQLFVKVTAGITVTDAEARSAYDADPRSWEQPEQRELRYVAVADETTAKRILTELRGGADFADVARRESADTSTKDLGGALGLVSADQLEPAFATEAFAAARGALFGPVETSRGWYVGQVQSIVAARTSYESLQDTIKDGLSSDRALKLWNTFVARKTEEAKISYAADFRPSATTPAPEAPGPQLPSPSPAEPTTAPAPGQ